MVSMGMETITPEKAEEMLSHNTANRPINKSLVQQYARDMSSDNWDVTGESIKFDIGGNLIDGQHRLSAVRVAKQPITTMVIRGLETSAKFVIDTGKSRTTRDALTFAGEVNCTDLAACIRAAIWYQGSKKEGGYFRISNHECMDWLESNPDMRDAVQYANKNKLIRKLLTSRVFGLTRFVTARIDPMASDNFFALIDLPPQDKEHPCFVLNRTIANARMTAPSARRGSMDYQWLVGVTAKAWNFYINKKPIKLMKLPRGSENVRFIGQTKNFVED